MRIDQTNVNKITDIKKILINTSHLHKIKSAYTQLCTHSLLITVYFFLT